MGAIREIANNLNRWNLKEEIDKAIREIDYKIEEWNKQQLEIGKRPNGSNISPNYADPQYAIDKVEILKSQAPLGIPNLKLTGDFYKGFKIEIKNNVFYITSTDLKTLSLEEKYGDIFGLNSENLNLLGQEVSKKVALSYIKNFKI